MWSCAQDPPGAELSAVSLAGATLSQDLQAVRALYRRFYLNITSYRKHNRTARRCYSLRNPLPNPVRSPGQQSWPRKQRLAVLNPFRPHIDDVKLSTDVHAILKLESWDFPSFA